MARRIPGTRRLTDCLEVYGKVGDKQFARRFPLDTPAPVLRAWRTERIAQLQAEHPRRSSLSLQADVERFLSLETGRRRDDFADLLAHWLQAFGDTPRSMITAIMVQSQLDRWKVEGIAASSLNHRRQALRTLYRRLDPGMPTPVDATRPYRQPEPEPRAVPEDVIVRVFEAMPASPTKARLEIICNTGMRHSELMRVQPEHVVLEADASVFVSSGKGGRHRRVPLTSRAQQAFRALAEAGAWGPFSVSSMHKTWISACRRAGVLEHYRPYDLRHRFATRLRERGADLADVQELLGHKNIATTRRYAPVVHAKLRSVVASLE